MVKKTGKKYCYLTPDFPKEALMVSIFFTSKDIPLMITPLSTISTSLDSAIDSIEEFVEAIKISENEDAKRILEVFDIAMITPITFQNLYPLKKEHWTGKKDPGLRDRVFAFVPVLNNLQLNKLLVLPFGLYKKKWEFAAAYPFSIFDGKEEVERYILGSEQVVDIRAKYAAFYSFGESKRLNWKTGEVSIIKKEVPQKTKIVN